MTKKQKQEQVKLNAAQKLFCRGVVNGLTPRAAYVKAFDCKESAAAAAASRLLKNVNIQSEINRLKNRVLEVHSAREEGREERALWTPAERMEKVQENRHIDFWNHLLPGWQHTETRQEPYPDTDTPR
jgi:phage terminase small subunit